MLKIITCFDLLFRFSYIEIYLPCLYIPRIIDFLKLSNAHKYIIYFTRNCEMIGKQIAFYIHSTLKCFTFSTYLAKNTLQFKKIRDYA